MLRFLASTAVQIAVGVVAIVVVAGSVIVIVPMLRRTRQGTAA